MPRQARLDRFRRRPVPDRAGGWATVLGVDRVGRDDNLSINILPTRVRLGTDAVEAAARRTHQILTEVIRHEEEDCR